MVADAVLPSSAVATLRSLVADRPLAFLDLETTGTDRTTDRIVEVAIVRLDPDGSIETLDMRVQPGVRIPREATAVHGISNEDVAGAPRFAEIAPRVSAFLDSADLAGYNLRVFDLPVLAKEFERARHPFSLDGRRVVDAQTIYFKKEPRDLASAVRAFAGREHARAHSALADAVATAEVLAGQLERYLDLPRGLDGLHDFSLPPEGRFVDPDKRFLWRDGEAVFAFGEHKGVALASIAKNNPAYLDWMLHKDFPEPAKKIVRDALQGKFPSRG